MAEGAKQALLTMRDISKTFPGVKALSQVDFTLESGQIHALLGENGAGKSTLIRVLTGVERMDAGQIELEGRRIHPKTPLEAQAEGISTVYQEVNLLPNLSVAENLFIGREPLLRGRIDWANMRARAKELLDRFELALDVNQPLSQYSVAIQQMVAIARAVDISAKVLILDEPTSSLDEKETEKLFAVMRMLREQGMGIVFVTHFLDQVYQVSDRITVLRNGLLVGSWDTASLSRLSLVEKMIGKEYDALSDRIAGGGPGEKAPDFVKAQALSSAHVAPFDLSVKQGEVRGVAGLLGSGRTEVLRLLFGVDAAQGGTLLIESQPTAFRSTLDAMQQDLAFCPEDRKTQGIIGELSVRDNIALALQAKRGMMKVIPKKEVDRLSAEYIQRLQIKTPDEDQLIRNLSGGNQQKVILARWLATDPKVLMLDEPTRGIDVGTKAEIQRIVVELADRGMAVIFVSSELDEMLRCCTHMSVMRDQEMIAHLQGEEITKDAVMRLIAGGDAA